MNSENLTSYAPVTKMLNPLYCLIFPYENENFPQ